MANFRPITKLVVNIGRGETRISYRDGSTRVIYANPSGHAYPGGMRDTILICDPRIQVNRYRPQFFLQRHFHLLAPRFPDLMANVRAPDKEGVASPSWRLERVEKPKPQWVRVIEWNDPEKGTMEVFNRFWHMENCVASGSDSPNCYCLQIKQITDHIKDLISPELQEDATVDAAADPRNFETKIKEVNDSLKQLHDLLELQDQSNRNQQLGTEEGESKT